MPCEVLTDPQSVPAHPVLEGGAPVTHTGEEKQDKVVEGKASAKVGPGTSSSPALTLWLPSRSARVIKCTKAWPREPSQHRNKNMSQGHATDQGQGASWSLVGGWVVGADLPASLDFLLLFTSKKAVVCGLGTQRDLASCSTHCHIRETDVKIQPAAHAHR